MAGPVRVQVVDPSAYTPPYDRALCAALAAAGAEVELVTSHFAYGAVAPADGYEVCELFYRHAAGPPGSRRRLALKLAQHGPDMLRYRRHARAADVVHFQWLSVQPADVHLLPRGRPLVLTAHDVLPREPRAGQLAAQRRLYERMDAVVVHSRAGRNRLTRTLGVEPERVHVIAHGAFTHLVEMAGQRPLPPDLGAVRGPVVLFFGLMRPYKGIEVLLAAWDGVRDALTGEDGPPELWLVGRPRMELAPLRAATPEGVRWVTRFLPDAEVGAFFRRADLVVLPYLEIDQSGVLATALAFGSPLLLSDVGGFGEVAAEGAAELVSPGDPAALHDAIVGLLSDRARRDDLASGAARAAAGPYSWSGVARRTLALYESLR